MMPARPGGRAGRPVTDRDSTSATNVRRTAQERGAGNNPAVGLPPGIPGRTFNDGSATLATHEPDSAQFRAVDRALTSAAESGIDSNGGPETE